MKKSILFIFLLGGALAQAQTDSLKNPVTYSGYIETYYVYDFARPLDHNRSGYIYSYNRHNEFNLNLGFVKASYQTERTRANLALMAGTYSNANLSAEPGVLKNIFEANAGVKIAKSRNLWIDAGVFPSHIGFESAIGKDCWTLTRSMLADNSPYYESGLKLSLTSKNEKWLLVGLLLNDWQRIQRLPGNNSVSFGHQVTFKPNAKVTLNSSSFVGSDTPDSTVKMRYFHNFYGQFQLSNSLGLILGFDNGMQQKAEGMNAYDLWYSPVFILKYSSGKNLSMAIRGEYYSDANGVIIATDVNRGFHAYGYSLNIDRKISDNALWRIEGRGFASEDKLFIQNGEKSHHNLCISSSLAISF